MNIKSLILAIGFITIFSFAQTEEYRGVFVGVQRAVFWSDIFHIITVDVNGVYKTSMVINDDAIEHGGQKVMYIMAKMIQNEGNFPNEVTVKSINGKIDEFTIHTINQCLGFIHVYTWAGGYLRLETSFGIGTKLIGKQSGARCFELVEPTHGLHLSQCGLTGFSGVPYDKLLGLYEGDQYCWGPTTFFAEEYAPKHYNSINQ